jgi:hypothetical protein
MVRKSDVVPPNVERSPDDRDRSIRAPLEVSRRPASRTRRTHAKASLRGVAIRGRRKWAGVIFEQRSYPSPLRGGIHKRLMTRPYRHLMRFLILAFLARRLSWWRSRRKVLSEVAYAIDRELGRINRRGLTGSRRLIRIPRRHHPLEAYRVQIGSRTKKF